MNIILPFTCFQGWAVLGLATIAFLWTAGVILMQHPISIFPTVFAVILTGVYICLYADSQGWKNPIHCKCKINEDSEPF